ncbi:cysteine-rich CWC family protein [Marinomonas shanghaiensis]|uniref:cysteine-rich CWC family protein n=1 Tax=Marinomonas shanghaiensis TaxID=2202418 RepID=UPI000DB93361
MGITMKCPFCKSDNGCELDKSRTCWCFRVIVPDDMLALIPEQQKGILCVCRRCIEFYRTDRLGFLKTFDLM